MLKTVAKREILFVQKPLFAIILYEMCPLSPSRLLAVFKNCFTLSVCTMCYSIPSFTFGAILLLKLQPMKYTADIFKLRAE